MIQRSFPSDGILLSLKLHLKTDRQRASINHNISTSVLSFKSSRSNFQGNKFRAFMDLKGSRSSSSLSSTFQLWAVMNIREKVSDCMKIITYRFQNRI